MHPSGRDHIWRQDTDKWHPIQLGVFHQLRCKGLCRWGILKVTELLKVSMVKGMEVPGRDQSCGMGRDLPIGLGGEKLVPLIPYSWDCPVIPEEARSCCPEMGLHIWYLFMCKELKLFKGFHDNSFSSPSLFICGGTLPKNNDRRFHESYEPPFSPRKSTFLGICIFQIYYFAVGQLIS